MRIHSAIVAALTGTLLLTGAGPSPDQLVADLARDANREGKLVVTVSASWNQALLPRLADAFKRRFGLTVDLQVAPVAATTQVPLEIAATKAGAPPTYDVLQGDDAETMAVVRVGGAVPIPHWEELLAGINPDVRAGRVTPRQVSRDPFTGTTFLTQANIKELVYNPKLIAAADLPRTHAELADPKFAGKFAQPPWTAHWETAPAVVQDRGREAFVDVVRRAGKNGGAVLPENTAVGRVVLGQYAFALAQDTLVRVTLGKDPQAPVAGALFRDYNLESGIYYFVRTRTPHPAGATLWVLWMTTPEAEAIWQPEVKGVVPYGSSAIDVAWREGIKSSRAPIAGYLDSPQLVNLLKWEQTAAGAAYFQEVAKAIRGE